jgi:hypothetical protein
VVEDQGKHMFLRAGREEQWPDRYLRPEVERVLRRACDRTGQFRRCDVADQ